jgi:hypothetical protein
MATAAAIISDRGFKDDSENWEMNLKVHKRENFFGFDFEICTFS